MFSFSAGGMCWWFDLVFLGGETQLFLILRDVYKVFIRLISYPNL